MLCISAAKENFTQNMLKMTVSNPDVGFTCNDGQCIKMERRCNQVIDCRDELGEDRCKAIILKSNFNKRIPPIYDKTDQKEATTLGAD